VATVTASFVRALRLVAACAAAAVGTFAVVHMVVPAHHAVTRVTASPVNPEAFDDPIPRGAEAMAELPAVTTTSLRPPEVLPPPTTTTSTLVPAVPPITLPPITVPRLPGISATDACRVASSVGLTPPLLGCDP
jgi:hypothetical protein